MIDRVFLDTNILIYLYSEDEDDKRDVAYKVVNSNTCVVSTQTLNEASNILLKKYNLNKTQIVEYLDGIEAVCDEIILVQRKTINQALSIKESYGYSYYDCLILASALESNCNIIFTEDMSAGQMIDNQLKIINPFNGVQ